MSFLSRFTGSQPPLSFREPCRPQTALLAARGLSNYCSSPPDSAPHAKVRWCFFPICCHNLLKLSHSESSWEIVEPRKGDECAPTRRPTDSVLVHSPVLGFSVYTVEFRKLRLFSDVHCEWHRSNYQDSGRTNSRTSICSAL